MPTIKLNAAPLALTTKYATEESVDVWLSHYTPSGRLALIIKTTAGEPMHTGSVNLPSEECPRDEVFVKNWGENEGVAKFLMVNDILSLKIEAHVPTGNVVALRCKFHASVQPQVEEYLRENNL